MSTPWLKSGRNYPTFSPQSGKKKKSNTPKCRAWLFFNPCAGSDCSCCVVKHRARTLWIKPWGFWHFSLTFFLFINFCSLVLFGAGPDVGVVLLKHMQRPGPLGLPVSLVGEGLQGAEPERWVPTLWSRPLGGPAQAQTQLGMEPVLRIGGVHRKRTTLCRQGKCWISVA